MKRRILDHRSSALVRSVIVGVLVIATACTGPSDLTPTTAESPVPTTTSPTVATTRAATPEVDEHIAYVQEALDFMQETFYMTDEVAWDTLQDWVFEMVVRQPSREGAYEAVEFAVGALATPHTDFVRPGGGQDTPVPSREPPSGERLGDVGYLSLPGTAAGSLQTLEYAGQVRQIMEKLDSSDPVCGWILDLRESVGGSSWGDWLSLGPLVGDDLLMRAGKSDSTTESVYYDDGGIRFEGPAFPEGVLELSERLPPDAYLPQRPDVPIAVLISSRTASAGEAIAVTFAGRPHTRFFGERTFGATTSSEFHEMPDGAVVQVAAGLYQDRSGHVYESGVHPDEPVQATTDSRDEVLNAAHDWVETQSPCI